MSSRKRLPERDWDDFSERFKRLKLEPRDIISTVPTEILGLIFAYFVADYIETFPQQDAPPSAPSGDPCSLTKLCLTSHRMCAVARPYLYHRITLTSGKSIAHLFRTLLETPRHRTLVQSLQVAGLLNRKRFWESTTETFRLMGINRAITLDNLSAEERQIFKVAGFNLPQSTPGTLQLSPLPATDGLLHLHLDIQPSGLSWPFVAVILGFSTCLQDLLIQLPENVHPETDERSHIWHILDTTEIGKCVLSKTMLPVLKSIRVQTGKQDLRALYRGIPLPFFRTHPGLHGLTTIEMDGDSGNWTQQLRSLEDPTWNRQIFSQISSADFLGQLEHLHLYRSLTSPTPMYQLLKFSKNLKSLVWTFRSGAFLNWSIHQAQDSGTTTVGKALSQLGDKVESLHFEREGSDYEDAESIDYSDEEEDESDDEDEDESEEEHEDEEDEDETDDFSTSNWLPNLFLKHLTMDSITLWGKDRKNKLPRSASLSRIACLLPTSLVDLTIIQGRPSANTLRETMQYHKALIMAFRLLAKECPERLPRLQTFTFKQRLPPKQRVSFLKKQEINLKKAFRLVGVEFVLK